MDCILDIFDTFIPGSTEGGQWELVGYSLTPGGTYGPGGNWPWTTNVNDHVSVDFTDIIQGFYRLNYFVTGDCGGQVTITIPAVGGGDAGTSTTVTVCSDSGLVNIGTELGAVFDQGILQAQFTYTGSGVSSGSYSAGASDTPLDDTFDPSTAAQGTYEFILTITPQAPVGYSLDGCDQCTPTTATLTIVVTEASIVVSLNDCWLTVDSVTGCSSGSLQVQRWNGANWIGIIADLPYQVDQDTDWRVQGVNCDCFTVLSNVVTSSGCCVDTPALTIQQSGCFLFRSSGTPCVGGTYLWWKSCDNGQTWQDLPFFGDTDNINTNDDCWYQLIRNCPSGCEQRSNILVVTGCAASCNGSLVASANGCTMEVTGGPTCGTTGTFTLQQNVNGSYVNVDTAAYGGYPQTFPITEDGTYRVLLDCDGDSCPPYESPDVVFSGCGAATCNSEVSVTVNECTITVNVTNCPSPFYVFKRLGNTVQSGTNNVYNALNNGVYDIEVFNCPDCSVLLDSVTLDMCGNNCSSGISATVDGCTVTASVTNCPSPTYIFKEGAVTLQSGPSNVYTHPTEETLNITVQATGCPGCSTLETTVQVNCVLCPCTTDITNTNCELFANDSNCAGYSAEWRYFNTSTFAWEVKGTGSSIVPDNNGLWERRLSKPGCDDVVEQINVDCLVDPCSLEFTSAEVDPGDCNQILFTYQGAIADNMTLILNYNQVGTTCGNAGGWTTFSPGAGSSFNYLPNGTGSGTIVVPVSLAGKCIRIILIDNDNGGCPAAEERVFFQSCCDATPSIQITGCAPYTLTVINAPAGSTFLWSTGATTSAIDVFEGTFSVVVTDGECVYNLQETLTCCSDPCLTQFERCVQYNWLNSLSQNTAALTYVTRFRVNGVDLIVSPQVVQWSASVFVPGSGNAFVTNPSLVNTLNALSNNQVAFELADNDDYTSCFNNPPSMINFLGLLRIVRSTCVTSLEIIIDILNGSPVMGQGVYRYTLTGLEFFSGGQWVDITTVFGTDYMIDNGPCSCELIDLCA